MRETYYGIFGIKNEIYIFIVHLQEWKKKIVTIWSMGKKRSQITYMMLY